MKKFVAYYRVSTARQGQSGLGLEAQRATVEAHCSGGQLLAKYTDIEPRKNNERPQLRTALSHARQASATLVIAKLDRLSRNVAFIAQLMEAEVEFVACDLPAANRFTLHVMAALAEQERQLIRERTKRALAAIKARGATLGTPANLTDTRRVKRNQCCRRAARTSPIKSQATALIVHLRQSGLSYWQIDHRLNEEGFASHRGRGFGPTQLRRLFKRHENYLQVITQLAMEVFFFENQLQNHCSFLY